MNAQQIKGKPLKKEAIIASTQAQKERKYWLNKLSGELEVSRFPPDKQDSGSVEPKMVEEKFTFSEELFSKLMGISSGNDAALHMMLVTGLVLLINKYSGSKDIIVATSIDKQDIEGEFVNTVLPLRIQPEDNITFKELLLQVKDTIDAAIENQNYPIEVLVYDDLGLYFEDESIFDIAILLENIQDKNYIEHINFDMVFSFYRATESIKGVIEYNAAMYNRDTIARIIRHLGYLFKQSLFNVDLKLTEIEILSREERKRLLKDFNDTRSDRPIEKTFHQLFEEQAARAPENPAVKYMDKELTYRELNAKTNQLARVLRNYGVREDRTVGIFLNRSLQMMESIIAVWKAGGAYIPMDIQYPGQRINEILKDSVTRVLITLSEYVNIDDKEKEYSGRVIELDNTVNEIANEDNGDLDLKVNINSLAYVIYTSGSTGKPKGVMVEQSGMMNHIRAKIEDLRMTETSVVAQNAFHTFDISVWQFFAALAVGGKTIIYPGLVVLDPGQFTAKVKEDDITILEVVPSYLSILLDALDSTFIEFESLEYLLVTGETLKPNLVKRWFEKYPDVRMVNAYGPTEASDDITHYIMDKPPELERLPIGSPLRNFNIYIVDHNVRLCPVGAKGEICVSGIGVGRGYLNDGLKTKTAFMKDPFAEEKGVRLYKTGDIGRWLPDGIIEFFGRKDHQVKIRGYRIELGEIESKLVEHPDVAEAVVIDTEGGEGDIFLCAYLVMVVPGQLNVSVLKVYLMERLPEYMIPAHYVELEGMPLTTNGKVDRKSLPEADSGAQPSIMYISEEELKNILNRVNDLSEDFLQESLDDTAALAEKEKAALEEYSKRKGKKYYPLSHAQKMVYYIEKTYPQTSCENDGDSVRYPGELDGELLEKAINHAVYRNENLRTRIVEVELDDFAGPAQYISDFKGFSLEYFDFSGEDGENRLEKWVRENTDKPFQFLDDDLFYFAFIKFRGGESGYYVKLHHIISDGGSTSFFIDEIDKIYQRLKAGETVSDQPNPSHTQFIVDEHEYLTSPQTAPDRKFWLQYLLPLPREMTISAKSGDVSNVTGDSSKLTFSGDLRLRMHTYCKERETSLYKLILTALSVYVWGVTGSGEFVIGTVNHGRYKEVHNRMLGMFINFLPIKITIDEHVQFQDFVRRIGEDVNNIIKLHGKYPSGLLSTELRKITGRDTKYFWNITVIGHPDKEKGNFHMEHISSNNEATPLTIHINCSNKDIDGILELEWVYQCEQFSAADIMRIHRDLEKILNDALDNPQKKLCELEPLGNDEKSGNMELPGKMNIPLEIGGNEIELEKIDGSLLEYADVEEAVTVVKEEKDGDKYLCAYVVSGKLLSEAELRGHLSGKLFPYMMPSYFIQLEKMPLTPEGNVNRKLLAEIDIPIDPDYIPPANETEETLMKIWENQLGLSSGRRGGEKIGMKDNFFAIGGDSIKAISMLSRINKKFNTDLKMVDLYRNDTIEKLAEIIHEAQSPSLTGEYQETLAEMKEMKDEFLRSI